MTRLRYRGALADLPAADRRGLLSRAVPNGEDVSSTVADIIRDVRARGDAALFEMAARFDGVELEKLEVTRAELARARDRLSLELRRAMERSARNIWDVHRAFAPSAVEVEPEPGITIGRRPDPLDRVGVYAPGGLATYPSSVLMGAIPARVAGVREVVLCSPPDPSGAPALPLLAAAAIANVDRVFAVGGAGAIAAMAIGTASIPRVDRIVGPGNAFVANAKLQLATAVAIDSPAGPSELLIIADDSADPAAVACELVAQAEHDPRASVIALGVGDLATRRIEEALAQLAPSATRRAIVGAALASRGAVLSVASVDEAIAFSNEYAPEHLALWVRDTDVALRRARNAGTVFVGDAASVAFGDYLTGANHVLPTGGLARAYSGLSTLDFVRWTTYQRVDAAAARRLADDVGSFADAERLPGHAAAARRWSTAS